MVKIWPFQFLTDKAIMRGPLLSGVFVGGWSCDRSTPAVRKGVDVLLGLQSLVFYHQPRFIYPG